MALSATDNANLAVAGAASTIASTQAQWMADLDASASSVVSELDASLTSMSSEISSGAAKAAAEIKEKAWYEKAWDALASVASVIATVVVGVLVFVAVAAFCVATFGAGPIALIAAGAIAGAVAGVAAKLAGDATKSLLTWSNQFGSPMEYLQAFIVGAVGGALTAGLAQVASPLVTGIVTAWGGSLADQLTDIGLMGEGWNWGEFLLTGALGSVFAWAGGRWLEDAVGNRILTRLFPVSGRSQSWNSFQTFARNTPVLRNLDNTLRGALWTNFVKSKITGAPADALMELSNATINEDPEKKKK
jgi:hypothetical protein